jgi:hypothetical protein
LLRESKKKDAANAGSGSRKASITDTAEATMDWMSGARTALARLKSENVDLLGGSDLWVEAVVQAMVW